jgi:hypothetical protein
MNYTDEQKADIINRVEKALAILKDMGLTVTAQVSKVPMMVAQANGEQREVWADYVQPYLQDTKFAPKVETPVTAPEVPAEAIVGPSGAIPSPYKGDEPTENATENAVA